MSIEFSVSTNFTSNSAVNTGNLLREMGQLQNQLEDLVNFMAQQQLERDEGEASGRSGGRSGAPSWIEAIANVLGKQLDDLSNEMVNAAEKVTKEEPSTLTDFQVLSQQFSMLMNTTSTALKALGEGMTAMARKQ